MTHINLIKKSPSIRLGNTSSLNKIFNINDYLSSLSLNKRKSLKDKFTYDLTFYEEILSLASDLFSIFKNKDTHKNVDIFISNFMLKNFNNETHDICKFYFNLIKVESIIGSEQYKERKETFNILESFFENIEFHKYLEENIPADKTINKKNKI